MRKIYSKVAVLAMGLSMLTSVSLYAADESTTATVNAQAGLAPVLDLSCSAVKFGVWRVKTGGARTASNTITLTESAGITTAAVAGTGASLAAGALSVPEAGSCNLKGSFLATDSIASLVVPTTDLSFTGAIVLGRTAATAVPTGLKANLSASTVNTVIASDGSAQWYVVGSMVIPEALVATNYGGYQSEALTVTYEGTAK